VLLGVGTLLTCARGGSFSCLLPGKELVRGVVPGVLLGVIKGLVRGAKEEVRLCRGSASSGKAGESDRSNVEGKGLAANPSYSTSSREGALSL
jgi:hypothetical protein